ncbi:hypothetical protein GPJ56_005173 [Histomonas meleagridis]|uniref:uncharacterized protein n=1 Tax=Histomonas meleagridis TaxID=135588 RepID=UPI00355959EB|nr:hypothetical protein GPJ56_005173 [Histomonas meleagridis]KAH0802689.1 hypothetical protein GO595_004738 [Histomonas meleagridis]
MSHTSEGPPTKSFLNSQIQNNTEYQISAKSQQNPNYYQPNYTQNYNVNYPPNNYYPINFQQSYTNPFNPQPHFNTDSSTPQVTFSQQPLNLLSKGQSAQINQTKANEPETQKGIEVTNSLDHVSAAYIANKQLKRWGWKTSEYKTVPKEKDTMQSVFRSVQTSKASSGQYNEDMEEPENENELDGIEEEIKLSPIKRLLSIWDKLYS